MKPSTNHDIWKKFAQVARIILYTIITVCLATFLFLKYIYPISTNATLYTYELGSEIPSNADHYVVGNKWATSISTVDLSNVDLFAPGTYDASIKRAFQTVPFKIEIVDTTAPDLQLKTENLYLQVGMEYTPDFFIKSVTDLSGNFDVSVSFSPDNSYCETLSTSFCGDYSIYVRAVDASGNETFDSLRIYSDTPPEITVHQDIYAATDTYITFEKNVTVYDTYDGEITENLVVDKSLISTDTPGTYDVIYRATDSFGFTSEVRYPVYLFARNDLQDLINTGQINRFDQMIVGAPNLYDGGYLESADAKEVMEHFLPAFIRIHYPGKSYGSGFIIQITDTDVIICTNHHVMKSNNDFNVYFHDGFSVQGDLVGRMEGVDVAFVKVPIENIPRSTFDTLMTVHINKGYVDSITEPTDINICFRTINSNGSVWRDRSGTLLALKTPIDQEARSSYPLYYSNVSYVTAVSPNLYGGASGSAILDSYGNLITMASFNRSVTNELGHKNFGVTLDDILTAYKHFFHEDANYQ